MIPSPFDLAGVGSAIASTVTTIRDVISVLQGAKTLAETKVIEPRLEAIVSAHLGLQLQLLGALREQQLILAENSKLRQEVDKTEAWKKESARYQLREFPATGIPVYSLIEAERKPGEPMHHLCPHCFDQGKKSMLQIPAPGYIVHKCPACSHEYYHGKIGIPENRSRRGQPDLLF